MENDTRIWDLQEFGYECMSWIGAGATAVVYRVRHQKSSMVYACKISDQLQWLRPEAILLKRLKHPLFPEYKEYMEMNERGYLIMEYVEGCSLKQHLLRRGHFCENTVVEVILRLADGLGYLHMMNPQVIYRDLKPDNIILQPDGKVRLLDMGTASIPAGWMAGTPGYASPEQLFTGKDRTNAVLAPTSDIYTLGMVMRFMLTGQEPCPKSRTETISVGYCPPVSGRIAEIVERCTKQYPEERIPDMREMIRELTEWRDSSSWQTWIREVKWRFGKKHRNKVIFEKNVWESWYKADW